MKIATAVAAAALALAAPALAEEPGYGKTQGAIPGVLVGPKLNLLALPPGAGVEAKLLGNALGLSLDVGLVPPVKIGKATASWLDWNAAAKYYPWAARFYVGAALGRRSFSAKATDDLTGRQAKADVSNTYLAPMLGWKFVQESGLFMGIDLGYQIVLAKSETFDFPAGVDPTRAQDVRDTADRIGKTGLPVLTLVQVGYLF